MGRSMELGRTRRGKKGVMKKKSSGEGELERFGIGDSVVVSKLGKERRTENEGTTPTGGGGRRSGKVTNRKRFSGRAKQTDPNLGKGIIR